VPFDQGLAAFLAVRSLILDHYPDHTFPVEIRSVAADSAYLSPFYERPSVSVSVSEVKSCDYISFLADVDRVLEPFEPRPHWGKIHFLNRSLVTRRYPRCGDFQRVREEFDPGGTFMNASLKSLFGQGSGQGLQKGLPWREFGPAGRPGAGRSPAQALGGGVVGWQERLHPELGEQDVGGRGEGGKCRDQPDRTVRGRKLERDREAEVTGRHRLVGDVALEFFEERLKTRVGVAAKLALQAVGHLRCPAIKVDDAGGQAVRVEGHTPRVDRRGEQVGRQVVEEQPAGGVGQQELAGPVDDHRRVGLVTGEDGLERLADGVQVLVAERALGVGGRVSGVQQEQVSLSQRQAEGLGETDHHAPAWDRPAALDEAEVPLTGPRAQGELKLADPAALPPAAQLRSE
jgi:hypothetical protein